MLVDKAQCERIVTEVAGFPPVVRGLCPDNVRLVLLALRYRRDCRAMNESQKAEPLRLHRHDTLDLDRDLVRQHRVTDRGAGMPSGVTEHFDK